MANSVTHALIVPVRKARYSLALGYFASDGTLTDPVTPDTEITKDFATYADCVEEVTTISATPAAGSAWLTLTGAEMDCAIALICGKVASGAKPPLAEIRPRDYPVIWSGTATAGSSTSITLPTTVPRVPGMLKGCIIRTTGGTGGGGTGGANNQARLIMNFDASGVCTVAAWEVTPDATTTFEILHTEFSLIKQADLVSILGDDTTVLRLKSAFDTQALVTIGVGSSATDIVLSSVNPAFTHNSQFIGKVLHFIRTTATTNLRSTGTRITAGNQATQHFTVDALPTAPASGDLAIIV